MPAQSEPPFVNGNQYHSEDSVCAHCDGVICHEPWCIALSADGGDAFWVVLGSDRLSAGDELRLHALGVAWAAEEHPS
jgi:hypothetical protein